MSRHGDKRRPCYWPETARPLHSAGRSMNRTSPALHAIRKTGSKTAETGFPLRQTSKRLREDHAQTREVSA